MFRAPTLALALAFALSIPVPDVLAQTSDAAPGETAAIGDSQFAVLTAAFEQRMQVMQQEMRTAVSEAGDATARAAALDAIEARYQPDAEAFASTFEAFIANKRVTASETDRAEMDAGLAAALTQLRSVPRSVRITVEQEATTPSPAS